MTGAEGRGPEDATRTAPAARTRGRRRHDAPPPPAPAARGPGGRPVPLGAARPAPAASPAAAAPDDAGDLEGPGLLSPATIARLLDLGSVDRAYRVIASNEWPTLKSGNRIYVPRHVVAPFLPPAAGRAAAEATRAYRSFNRAHREQILGLMVDQTDHLGRIADVAARVPDHYVWLADHARAAAAGTGVYQARHLAALGALADRLDGQTTVLARLADVVATLAYATAAQAGLFTPEQARASLGETLSNVADAVRRTRAAAPSREDPPP